MSTTNDKLKELLVHVKSYHDYEISQIDRHIQASQYIILVAGIFLSTSIFAIEPHNNFQTYILSLSIIALFIAILLSFPYSFKKSAKYKLSPQIYYMINMFLSPKYNYNQYLKWLIKIYERAIYENRAKNLKRHFRQKIALCFVLVGGLCLTILSISNILNQNPNNNNKQITSSTFMFNSRDF